MKRLLHHIFYKNLALFRTICFLTISDLKIILINLKIINAQTSKLLNYGIGPIFGRFFGLHQGMTVVTNRKKLSIQKGARKLLEN